jgi:hypothetical protein
LRRLNRLLKKSFVPSKGVSGAKADYEMGVMGRKPESISLYNAEGSFVRNNLNVYTLNNITAIKGADGSVAVQFGGRDDKIPNCLPIMPSWNYLLRLYRPHPEILNGSWEFPQAKPVS